MEIATGDHPRSIVNVNFHEDGDFMELWTRNSYDEDDIVSIVITREMALELAEKILNEMSFKNL